MGIPDHLTCLFRNLYVGQEATELDMEQQTGSKLAKEYIKAVYCYPGLFNFYAEYIMRNAGLEETQAGIKIGGRNINNLRYADDTTLMGGWGGISEDRIHEPLLCICSNIVSSS